MDGVWTLGCIVWAESGYSVRIWNPPMNNDDCLLVSKIASLQVPFVDRSNLSDDSCRLAVVSDC